MSPYRTSKPNVMEAANLACGVAFTKLKKQFWANGVIIVIFEKLRKMSRAHFRILRHFQNFVVLK